MSARRAYSNDGSDGAYSDDFISDEDRSRRTQSPYSNRRYGNRVYGGKGDDSRTTMKGRGGHVPRGRGRGRGRRGGRGNSRASEPISYKHDNVTKRVLSASRNRVNEMRNQVEEMKILIKDLETENKLYKKMQFRQEKAIKQFEDKENDLPRILDKHNSEVRALKDQNRKLKERFDRTDHYLRDAEDELERVKKKMNKYKEMCEQKELQERDELSRKLTKMEIDMEEKDVKIKELERHMEILKKNHRHQLGIEMARQRDLKQQLEETNYKNSEVESQLKEKSKQLDYRNIYTLSINRASSNDLQSTDASPHRKLKKQSSLTELTPRDKAKFYEEKKREEVRKQKEQKVKQEKKKRNKWEKVEKEKAKERARSESPLRDSPLRESPLRQFNFVSLDKSLEEREKEQMVRRSYQEEQEEYRKQSEREKFTLQDKKRDLERRQEEDRRKREDGERKREWQKEELEREERERKMKELREREDRDRRERERKEEEEQYKRQKEEEEIQRKEKVERDRREMERTEQERRIQQEKEKLENDPKLKEERRKKDELLRRLQDMDKIGNDTIPFKKESDPFKSKENTGGYDTPGSKKSDPKEYSFTNQINNLHQGRPARDDVTVPYIQRQRQRTSKDDDEFGYMPSFGPGRGAGTKPPPKQSLSLFDDDEPQQSTLKFDTSSTTMTKNTNKDSNLLENLFGPSANTNSRTDKLSKAQANETFFLTDDNRTTESPKRMNGPTNTSTFPWDNTSSSSSPTKNNPKSLFDRGGASTLFGGGAAIVDDDVSQNSGRVLPRRTRQNNVSTFSSKPSVTAVDPFEDEIEEVVL